MKEKKTHQNTNKKPQNTNHTSQIKLITAEYDYNDDPNEFYDNLLSVLKEIPKPNNNRNQSGNKRGRSNWWFFSELVD